MDLSGVRLPRSFLRGAEKPSLIREKTSSLITGAFGVKIITAEMVPETDNPLILFVPSSVEEINFSILEGKNVTIAGKKNSYAERFSHENDINFISQIISETGINY